MMTPGENIVSGNANKWCQDRTCYVCPVCGFGFVHLVHSRCFADDSAHTYECEDGHRWREIQTAHKGLLFVRFERLPDTQHGAVDSNSALDLIVGGGR